MSMQLSHSKVRNAPDHAFIDPWLLVPTIILTVIGILIVYTSSFYISARFRTSFGHFYFAMRHIFNIGLGAVIMLALSVIDGRELLKSSRGLMGAAILLLIGLLIFGHTIAGVRRWIRIAGFSFQPSEFAKFALIVYAADYLHRKGASEFKTGFLPLFGVISFVTLLVALQPSLSMAALIFAIGMVIMFVGNTKIRYLIVTFVVGSLVFLLFIHIVPYAKQRIVHFLAKDALQVRQGIAGMAQGGIWGKGLGKGVMKFLYLPAPFTDFIFAVIGEEFGFVGTMLVASLYLIIMLRGLHIANELVLFGRRYMGHALLAVGFAVAIGLFGFVNISIVLGKLPPTGVPLPFITYGGSAALFNFSAMGVLLSLSSTLHNLKAERRLLF